MRCSYWWSWAKMVRGIQADFIFQVLWDVMIVVSKYFLFPNSSNPGSSHETLRQWQSNIDVTLSSFKIKLNINSFFYTFSIGAFTSFYWKHLSASIKTEEFESIDYGISLTDEYSCWCGGKPPQHCVLCKLFFWFCYFAIIMISTLGSSNLVLDIFTNNSWGLSQLI